MLRSTTLDNTSASIRIGTKTTTLGRDANFQLTSVLFPAADTLNRTFSDLHIPINRTSANAPYASTTDQVFGYAQGPRMERVILNPSAGTIRGRFFSYDSLGQLVQVQAKHAPGPYNTVTCLQPPLGYECDVASEPSWTVDTTAAFAYDAAANRTDNAGTYTAGNRITAFGGCTYQTDLDGNVTSRAGCANAGLNATLTWTRENRLSTVTNGGTTTTLRYGPDGELVRVDIGGSPAMYFLWDGDALVAELNATATAKLVEYPYYPGLDRLHALVRNDSLFTAQTDGVGNVIALTDQAKALKRTYGYDHWGRLTSGSDFGAFGDKDRARFKGALSMSLAGDALYYMRNRWYEPQSGRFLSADPIGLSGGLNAYTFAGNDPVNASDPEGLCATIRVNMKTGEWHAYGCGPRSDANHCWGIANSNIHPQCTAGTTDEVGGSGDFGAFGSWGGSSSVPGGIPSHSPGPHALTAGYGSRLPSWLADDPYGGLVPQAVFATYNWQFMGCAVSPVWLETFDPFGGHKVYWWLERVRTIPADDRYEYERGRYQGWYYDFLHRKEPLRARAEANCSIGWAEGSAR